MFFQTRCSCSWIVNGGIRPKSFSYCWSSRPSARCYAHSVYEFPPHASFATDNLTARRSMSWIHSCWYRSRESPVVFDCRFRWNSTALSSNTDPNPRRSWCSSDTKEKRVKFDSQTVWPDLDVQIFKCCVQKFVILIRSILERVLLEIDFRLSIREWQYLLAVWHYYQ